MKTEKFLLTLWIASLAGTFLIALHQIGNPFFYWLHPAPPGQALYITAKILGLLAIVMLWWQSLFGVIKLLPGEVNFVYLDKNGFHRLHGAATAVAITLHVASFLTAASLRSGHPAFHWLMPDFANYYTSRVSLGALALFMLLSTLLMPVLGKRTKIMKIAHYAGFAMLPLAMVHAWSIGSETKSLSMYYIFVLLLTSAFTLLAHTAFAKRRNTVTCPSSGGTRISERF